jgi:hypothetical protein
MYDYTTELRRKQAKFIQNHLNPIVRATGQGKATHRKYEELKIGGG